MRLHVLSKSRNQVPLELETNVKLDTVELHGDWAKGLFLFVCFFVLGEVYCT